MTEVFVILFFVINVFVSLRRVVLVNSLFFFGIKLNRLYIGIVSCGFLFYCFNLGLNCCIDLIELFEKIR